MGFLSFNEKYYAGELGRLEGRPLNREELLEVKRLLKLLDDLEEEGYTELGRALEREHRAVSRLRGILRAHGEESFPVRHAPIPELAYGGAETDIDALFTELSSRARRAKPSENEFLPNIRAYCRWLGRRRDFIPGSSTGTSCGGRRGRARTTLCACRSTRRWRPGSRIFPPSARFARSASELCWTDFLS